MEICEGMFLMLDAESPIWGDIWDYIESEREKERRNQSERENSNVTQSCNHEMKSNQPASGNIEAFILQLSRVGVERPLPLRERLPNAHGRGMLSTRHDVPSQARVHRG
jgi:hypothetical protein